MNILKKCSLIIFFFIISSSSYAACMHGFKNHDEAVISEPGERIYVNPEELNNFLKIFSFEDRVEVKIGYTSVLGTFEKTTQVDHNEYIVTVIEIKKPIAFVNNCETSG